MKAFLETLSRKELEKRLSESVRLINKARQTEQWGALNLWTQIAQLLLDILSARTITK